MRRYHHHALHVEHESKVDHPAVAAEFVSYLRHGEARADLKQQYGSDRAPSETSPA